MPPRIYPDTADLAPLDIGRPDDDARALIDAIRAYAIGAADGTAEDRLRRIRGCRHILQAAYQAWVITLSIGHYDTTAGRVILDDAAAVSAMAKSTLQTHVARGIALLPAKLRARAEAAREEMSHLGRGRRPAS